MRCNCRFLLRILVSVKNKLIYCLDRCGRMVVNKKWGKREKEVQDLYPLNFYFQCRQPQNKNSAPEPQLQLPCLLQPRTYRSTHHAPYLSGLYQNDMHGHSLLQVKSSTVLIRYPQSGGISQIGTPCRHPRQEYHLNGLPSASSPTRLDNSTPSLKSLIMLMFLPRLMPHVRE
jgi:hypothetical protein